MSPRPQTVRKMTTLKSTNEKIKADQQSQTSREQKTHFVANGEAEVPPEQLPLPCPSASDKTESAALNEPPQCKCAPKGDFISGTLPFRALSMVTPVGQAKPEGPCGEAKTESVEKEPCPQCFANGVLFSDSASFPLRGYGQRGEVFDREGLVIYEGMQLGYNNSTGDFEVSFVVEAPAQPINLRLQFFVKTTGGRIQTITLPPIRVTESQVKENRDSSSWIIRHAGNSAALRCDNIQSIRRTGTVRFGYGTTLDDSDKTGF